MKIVSAEDIPAQAEDTPRNEMEVFKVCKEMEAICLANKGVGLSAVQVGIPWKLFILQNFSHKTCDLTGVFRYFVDCEYERLSDEKISSLEGCLSLPNRLFLVQRWKDFTVKGQELILERRDPTFVDCQMVFYHDQVGGKVSLRNKDRFIQMAHLRQAAFQHEIDHHHNILIRDIGKEVQPRQPIHFLGEQTHGSK